MDREITCEEMLELTKTFNQNLAFFKIQQEYTPQCPVEHYDSISKVLKDLQSNIDELLLALTEKQLNTVKRRIETLQNRHADGNNTDSGISCNSIVSTSSVRFSETEIGGARMSATTENSQTIPTQETEAPAIVSTNKAKEHEDTSYDEKSHPLKKDSLKPEPMVAHPADESSSEEENVGACAMRENKQLVVKNHRRALVIHHEDLDTTAENSENQEDDENYPDDSYA